MANHTIISNENNINGSKTIENLDIRETNGQVLITIRYYTSIGEIYDGQFIYSRSTKKILIVALKVVIDSQSLSNINSTSSTTGAEAVPQLIKGCKLRSISGNRKCFQCQPGFYLSKDTQCYPAIKNCQIQSGILCLICKSGFLI